MAHIDSTGLFLLTLVVVGVGCGGGDDDNGGGVDAAATGDLCEFQTPVSVAVGQVVTEAQPNAAQCPSGLHFYRFTPSVAGVYTITKSGGGSLGFCDTETADGCICGVNINCCTDCTLTFALPSGNPLPASSNNQIYVMPNNVTTDAYTFTVTGPN